MSREIKFRAWDKEDQVMDWPTEISWDDGGDIQNVDAYHKKMTNNFVLEQFAGLKDVNGKNIYEGDVVRVFDVYEDVGYVDTVIWGGKDDYPAFDLQNHAVDYDENALSSIFNGDFEIIEVIGNVHTNPELLEEEK